MNIINHIDTAQNGQQALDKVIENEQAYYKKGERKYDIIFLDLGMPIKDGYEACEHILQHYH
jgi:CheY-like chemotaxis protein